jgi:hypothetical protein
MEKATIIGIDLAKRVFQVHAAAKDGRPVLRKKVSRAQLLGFLTKQPRAIVAMEACATAHEWGRAISGLGHDVRPYGQRTELTARISRRLAMVIAQKAAQSLAAPHRPLTLLSRRPRKQQDVAPPLMIPLSMEMVDIVA